MFLYDDRRSVAVVAADQRRKGIPVDGGPLDGDELDVEAEVDEVSVTMMDGTRHRYVRTRESRGQVVVMRWAGRE
ncbi:hypothetical protein PA7_34210 [Pseudonocardia asaccharolytica DSM 44247 = NBRC 16224]|uniref:Uncharacterized protein n=1 Tax=Pseudonocardia asaccharolytica DSM 44247 = NBRC 16224 TaxID=1123024 RepID=A0A511D7H9_9PSEU|nr:hypothetical protein PA7_34210 [Pseudonocardia asaccharolytica DSM 44247 = NBRC 16224]